MLCLNKILLSGMKIPPHMAVCYTLLSYYELISVLYGSGTSAINLSPLLPYTYTVAISFRPSTAPPLLRVATKHRPIALAILLLRDCLYTHNRHFPLLYLLWFVHTYRLSFLSFGNGAAVINNIALCKYIIIILSSCMRLDYILVFAVF